MEEQRQVRMVDIPRLREHIAQFLSVRDLKACCLVCRTWYATAYPLLRPFVKAQAMDVPELAAMVAKHLEVSDLKTCALVRRSWYDNFNPCVWSTFVLKDVPSVEPSCCSHSSLLSPPSPPSSLAPSTTTTTSTTIHKCLAHPRCCKKHAVYKNADLIRHLVVRYVGPDFHPEEFYAVFIEKCCSLRSLSFFVDSAYQEYTVNLLRANPRVCHQVSHFLLPDMSGSSPPIVPHARVLTIGRIRDCE